MYSLNTFVSKMRRFTSSARRNEPCCQDGSDIYEKLSGIWFAKVDFVLGFTYVTTLSKLCVGHQVISRNWVMMQLIKKSFIIFSKLYLFKNLSKFVVWIYHHVKILCRFVSKSQFSSQDKCWANANSKFNIHNKKLRFICKSY